MHDRNDHFNNTILDKGSRISSQSMAATYQRPANRARLLNYAQSFEVLVGSLGIPYAVYDDVMKNRAPFFRAALAHASKEALPRQIRLPQYHRDVFNDCLDCIYQGLHEVFPDSLFAKDDDYRDQYHRLTQLHILANEIRDLRLCNDICDYFISISVVEPYPETITRIYNHFREKHLIRNFIMAVFMTQCDSDWLKKHRRSLPVDFIFDITLECRDARTWMTGDAGVADFNQHHGQQRKECYWHQHDKEVPQSECQAQKKIANREGPGGGLDRE